MRWLFSGIIACILVGCGTGGSRPLNEWMGPGEKPRVISTTGIVGDMVSQIGGDAILHVVLIRGELDPHSYSLVKGDIEKLTRADAIFSNGLGLEHGASLRVLLEDNEKVWALGEGILEDHLLKVDGQIDPHAWMDLSLWSEAIDGVASRLAKIAPEHREEIFARAAQTKEHYLQLDRELIDRFAGIPSDRRYLVTSHDAFHYFARRYLSEGGEWKGRFAAPEGLSPDGELSNHDIEKITQFLKRHNIGVVFPESNVSLDSLKKVVCTSSKLGQNVVLSKQELYGDALGVMGSAQGTYMGMMRYNGEAIAGAME